MLEIQSKLNYIGKGLDAQLCIIWLHGLGASNDDFVPMVNELKLNKKIKFVFPNAKLMPITLNNGYIMRAWYDIKSLDANLSRDVDINGIIDSCKEIDLIVNNLLKEGFLENQIIIAGFSQGGVISYIYGLSTKRNIRGVIALSCYLPNDMMLLSKFTNKKELPIFSAHGILDQVVPHALGINAVNKAREYSNKVCFKTYDMEHSLCFEEIKDIENWLLNL